MALAAGGALEVMDSGEDRSQRPTLDSFLLQFITGVNKADTPPEGILTPHSQSKLR